MSFQYDFAAHRSVHDGWTFQKTMLEQPCTLTQAQKEQELLSLARYLQQSHPAYRQLYQGCALDTIGSVPVLDKAGVQALRPLFLEHAGVAPARLENYLDNFDIRATLDGHLAFHTSGSSGQRGVTLYGLFDFGRSLHALYQRTVAPCGGRSLSYIGLTDRYNGGNQWMYHMGAHVSLQLLHYFDDAELQLERLLQFQPEVLFTKPSKLRQLGRLLRQRGKALHQLQHIISVGEDLSVADAADIHDLFGIAAHNSFSTTETGPIAYQDDPRLRELVLYDYLNHVEILDPAGQPITVAGRTGRLVVSSIYNMAFPLLRYDLADCVCWVEGKVGKAISFIQGRNKEHLLFTRDGVTAQVEEIVFWTYADPEVQAVQFVQQGPAGLLVLVEPRAGAPCDRARLRASVLAHLAQSGCPLALSVEVERVGGIAPDPRTSKVRRVVPQAGR